MSTTLIVTYDRTVSVERICSSLCSFLKLVGFSSQGNIGAKKSSFTGNLYCVESSSCCKASFFFFLFPSHHIQMTCLFLQLYFKDLLWVTSSKEKFLSFLISLVARLRKRRRSCMLGLVWWSFLCKMLCHKACEAAEYIKKSRWLFYTFFFFFFSQQIWLGFGFFCLFVLPVSECLVCSFVFCISVHPMWQEPLEMPGGERQSPIDINLRKSVFDPNLKPLVTQYDPRTCQQIWNNGYSFLVEYDDTTDKSSKSAWITLIKIQSN